MTSNYLPLSRHYATGGLSWPDLPISSLYIRITLISSTGDNLTRLAVASQEKWQSWLNTMWSYDTSWGKQTDEQTLYRDDLTTIRAHMIMKTSRSSPIHC